MVISINKCGVCKRDDVEVWTIEEIGKMNWTTEEINWFKKNSPVCESCIRDKFKNSFDEYGKSLNSKDILV